MSEGFSQIELSGSSLKVEFPAVLDYGCRGNPELTQIPGDNRIWIDLNERARTLTLSECKLTSSANKDNLLQILEDNSKITMRSRKPDDTYDKIDGVNTSLTVGCLWHSNARRMDFAGEKYSIGRISLVEAS